MERPIPPAEPVRPAAEAGLAALDDVARSRVASAAAAALADNTRAAYARGAGGALRGAGPKVERNQRRAKPNRGTDGE